MSVHLFNFKARFVHRIETKVKQQTIRSDRKRMPVANDDARLQAGDRFHPVLIGWSRVIIVEPIRINVTDHMIYMDSTGSFSSARQLDQFSVLDGFDDWADMKLFWTETHPTLPLFSGFRTFWGDSFRKVR